MPDRSQSTVPLPRAIARQLVLEPTPEAQARIAEARADIHDLLAILNTTAARTERFCAQARQSRKPDCDLPDGIPTCKPGDSFNMPVDLGGEFFETDPEAFFWSVLGFEELREGLTGMAAKLACQLDDADPIYTLTQAEEMLARLPVAMLWALRTRLAELEGALP